MTDLIVTLAECSNPARVGGKAAVLGALLRAGFAVPDGFVVLPDATEEDAVRAYRALGSPTVAVRSSASIEDGKEASFAGQFTTALGVEGDDALRAAIRRCRDAARETLAGGYARAMGGGRSPVGVPLLVQRFVPADVAGVLFTADPLAGDENVYRLEAAAGMGEGVVSGAVQPECLTLDARDGAVLDVARIGDAPCLASAEVDALWRLGRRVADLRGAPQDIEWAIMRKGPDAGLFLLQARPITTLAASAEKRACRDETRAWLRQRCVDGAGPWALHNLAESAPHPTPLAADLLRRFLSGAGGFGNLYRMLGYSPADAIDDEGILDFIAGRPYVDLSRAPLLLGRDWPYRFDSDLVRRRPSAADAPPTLVEGSVWSRLRAAGVERRAAGRLETLAGEVRGYDNGLYSDFAAWCREESGRDAADRDPAEWVSLWRERARRIYDTFAPRALLPALLLARDTARLRAYVADRYPDEDPMARAQSLLSGGASDASLRENDDLLRVGRGEMRLEDWLERYGHRGPGETDIGAPRWRERPDEVACRAARLVASADATESPKTEHVPYRRMPAALIEDIRLWSRLREEGRSLMALGTDLLRRQALAAGRRLGIEDDVFLLSEDELLTALRTGYAPTERIRRRKRRRQAEASLHLPDFIGPAEIESIGDTPPVDAGGEARPIAAGIATGPAAVLLSPDGELSDGAVLVCPSTDPSWTPLFLRAAALVVERGGLLSHGAVIAREIGIPAVVLPGATRRFHTGEIITVDALQGRVYPAGGEGPPDTSVDDVPSFHPRRLARTAAVAAVLWLAVLLAAFLLPERSLLQPVYALLDTLLWPLVPALGRAGAVAVLACASALALLALEAAVSPVKRAPGKAAGKLTASLVPAALLLGPLVFLVLWMGQRFGPQAAYADPGAAVSVVAVIDSDLRSPVTLTAPSLAVDGGTQTLPPIRETLERLRARWAAPSNLSGLPWEARAAAEKARREMLADLDGYLRRGVPPQPLHWTLRLPEGKPGRYSFTIRTPDYPPLRGAVIAGENVPPAPASVTGNGPIRALQIHYRRPDPPRRFWTPFSRLGYPVDFGWLGAYLAASLATTFTGRWILSRMNR